MASKGGKFLVAAIDFGTTYSGYAFSFKHEYEQDPTKASGKTWIAGANTPGVSLKTSTTLLLKPDGTFDSFGYEAEDRYAELAMDNEHMDYYYFRRFKMLLFDNIGLNRKTALADDKGRCLLAKEVFSMSIWYLKEHLLDMVQDRVANIRDTDIQWVLTVPAIWNDAAKQFMREAANDAGIPDSQLLIALEPEGAALFCRNLPVERTVGTEAASTTSFAEGTQYLVLDAGGGTADITVHKVTSDGYLKEVYKATGGAWGGTNVDEAFREQLFQIVSHTVLIQFSKEHTEDYLELFREFETKKRTISSDTKRKVNFRLPLALTQLYKTVMGGELNEDVAQRFVPRMITVRGDKLQLDALVIKQLFTPSVDSILEHVQELLQKPEVKGTSTILMVGGFSESPMLQDAMRKMFPKQRIIIPRDAGIAVVVGAVIYGHNPSRIAERVCKYTYGVSGRVLFIEGVHRESYKVVDDFGDVRCENVLSVHIAEGTSVILGEAQKEQLYFTPFPNIENLVFTIYESSRKDNMYVTDPGCREIGRFTVPISDPGPEEKLVRVRMIYGGTELVVEGRDEHDNITTGTFDFLG